MEWLLNAAVSSVIAGIVTITVSLLVECFGGVIGGVLGSIPHVAVVGAIGFALRASPTSKAFKVAMLAMPIGMLMSALYLATMRLLSVGWKTQGIQTSGTPNRIHRYQKLACVMAIASFIFAVCLVLVVFVLRPETHSLPVVQALAFGSFAVELVVGLLLVVYFPSAPKGNTRTPCAGILTRGAITTAIFFVAMFLAESFPALAGILVNIPIVHTIIVVSLWLGQSEEVAMGTAGPMCLGMLSASCFAVLASFLMPSPALGIAGGATVSFLAAIVCVTLPVLVLLQCRNRNQAGTRTEKEGVEELGTEFERDEEKKEETQADGLVAPTAQDDEGAKTQESQGLVTLHLE